jgi:hypothetical protein
LKAQGDTQRAANYTARAYVVFARLGAAPEARQAAQQLADILGSEDAANAYLTELSEDEED